MNKHYQFKLLVALLALLLSAPVAMAQYTISGVVTDAASGETLMGVTIFDAATSSGTSTDINGRYSLQLPSGTTTLRISFIGYITHNIQVTGSNGQTIELDVSLNADVANLEELVVTGLASSVKRSNLANAVSSLDGDKLTGSVAPPTLDNALSGKIPGVNIRSNSGAPGGSFNVQMRGVSTLGAGSSQPLYIIDGVYVNNSTISTGRYTATGATGSAEDDSGNRLADLNPDDIKTIEVLKGSSAAAIYGQRANAGVVIITTKRGASGGTQVSFEQNLGFSTPLRLLGVADWDEDKINTYYGASAPAELAKYQAAKSSGNIFDYEKMVYDNRALTSETNISVSGGAQRVRYFVSGGVRAEDGIVKNTNFDRGSLRANLDFEVTDNIRVATSSSLVRTTNQRGFTGNQNGSGASIGYNLAYTPTYAQLKPDANGVYPDNPYFDDNILAVIEHAINRTDVTRSLHSVKLDADLYKREGAELMLSLSGGVDYLNFGSEIYLPEFLQSQKSSANPGDVIHTQQDNLNTNLQAIMVYRQDFNKVSTSTQVGFSRFDESIHRQQLRGRGLVPGQRTIGQAQVQSVPNQSTQKVIDMGWFGQEEVNWDDKLIGTIGIRMDRSSLNYKQDDYYLYPKASLAANLANFDFLDVKHLDQLKLRVAYGETGGLPNFGDTFNALNGSIIGGQLGLTASTRDIDPNLKPERAKEIEFGTDISLFDNKVSLTATYYIKNVEDLILDLPTAASTGVTAIATNAAELENKGIELGLSLQPVRNRKVTWTSDILFWTNDSKITKLNIPPKVSGGFGVSLGNYLLQEGFSPTTVVGIPAIPGAASMYTIYGDAQPDFQMSFGNNLSFLDGFQFNFLLHWSKGGSNINLFDYLLDDGGTAHDWNDDVGGNYKGLDRLSGFPPESYVQDASYMKLREVSLFYTLPKKLLDDTFNSVLSNVRVGISGSNLWMWSPFRGYDPEASTFGTQAINQSVSVAPYPSSKKVMFNLKLDF